MADRTLELEWLRGRQTGVGSSNSPVLVLGQVYGRTPLDVYLSKKTEVALSEESPDLRRGHTYEGLAAAMYEQRSGIKVYVPETDQERYVGYQRRDPDRDWLYADFDGICEDGWVLEVKSPRQRRCDRFRTEGAPEYYQVQCQHLAHIANVAHDLPGVGSKWRGKIKGTRLVIYEPENVDLIVIELPLDPEMVARIIDTAEDFWKNHVLADNPPLAPPPTPRKKRPKGKGGKYTDVEGEAWEEASAAFLVAKQLADAAKARVDRAKATIAEAMQSSGLERVMVPDGTKFQYVPQAGRRTFDKKAAQAALLKIEADCPACQKRVAFEPGIDWARFDKVGAESMVFRSYGAATDDGEGGLDDRLLDLHGQLEAFAGRDLDPELAVDVFEDLRNQAELYERMLAVEIDQVRAGLQNASEAFAKKIGVR